MDFEVSFLGHPNVRSTHATTIEVTTASDLTPRGDCIVGVGATSGCAGIPDGIKRALRDPGAAVTITIRAGGMTYAVHGRGHGGLLLSDCHDIVVRKSSFVCPRTLAVLCDAASADIPREMIRLLQDPNMRGTLRISVDESHTQDRGAGEPRPAARPARRP